MAPSVVGVPPHGQVTEPAVGTTRTTTVYNAPHVSTGVSAVNVGVPEGTHFGVHVSSCADTRELTTAGAVQATAPATAAFLMASRRSKDRSLSSRVGRRRVDAAR